MTEPPKGFDQLKALFPAASVVEEAGIKYVILPKLKIESGGTTHERDALLCTQTHSGYATRLFLSDPIPGRQFNSPASGIIGRNWHTWSWKDVSAGMPVLEILLNHLRALK